MRFKIQVLIVALSGALNAQAQGFVNLDFESANVSGYSPNSSTVPSSAAFLGWSAFYAQAGIGTNQASQVAYDAISLGGAVISVNDTDTGHGFIPLQGQFSAFLFGGSFQVAVIISQTALVPMTAQSLQVQMGNYMGIGSFTVSLGGQTISMSPLADFPTYTLYGGDISSFANQVATLSFTVAAVPVGSPGPNPVLLDDIVFSTQTIPEPNAVGLFTFGALLLGCRFMRRPR